MKTYRIDLSEPETERWREVASEESESIRKLTKKLNNDFSLNLTIGSFIKKILHGSYFIFGFPYYKEIVGLSSYSGIKTDDLILLNLSYELSQVSGWIKSVCKLSSLFACTSVAIKTAEGVILGRNYDSSFMKDNVCRFIFKRTDGREYESIGYPGIVGITTGIVRNSFGISLNSAPPAGIPNPNHIQPTVLIRKILENYNNFEEAQYILSKQLLCTSGIFTLFSEDKFSVFERTKTESVEIEGVNSLIRCNHFRTKKLSRYNGNCTISRSKNEFATKLLQEIEYPTFVDIEEIMQKVSIDKTVYKSVITSDRINILD